jgi:plastocyanin
MSDETPTPVEERPAGETSDVPAVPGEPGVPDHPSPLAEPVTFRSKFLAPLLIPIGVAATIVFYVLNVSRIFLASESALAVTFASFITILILAGGSALAASPRLRSSSVTLMLGGGFLVLLMGGLISIGAASPEKASGPVECKPVKQKLTIVAGVGGSLRFSPQDPTVKAGCIDLSIVIDGSHTLQFDTPTAANAFRLLGVDQKTWAGTLPAGKYPFHCTIDAHAASGMVGTLTVTR